MKTCRKGHPQTGDNVEHRSDGKTRCKVCDRARRRERYGERTDVGRKYEALARSVSIAIGAIEARNPRLALAVLKPRGWVRNEDFENLLF